MVKYFSIENFYSIKNENIVEFDLNLSNSHFSAHPTLGFAGTNASGKTNFIRGLNFVHWFMGHSFFSKETKIPIKKFIGLEHLPTKFNLIFTLENEEIEYELEINGNKVLTEVLSSNGSAIYTRSLKNVDFGESVGEFSTKDLRDTSSVVSYATNFDSHTTAKKIRAYIDQGQTNVDTKGHNDIEFNISNLLDLSKTKLIKNQAIETAKLADIGIIDFFVKEEDPHNLSPELAFFKHKIGQSFSDFTQEQESSGTLQFFAVLSNLLPTLETGGLVILDEIEIKLHQNLVAYLIGLFQNQEINKNSAQLIFTFHNSLFMDILEPEQLWFAEKNNRGETDLFCAANFEDIEDIHKKSLEKLYRIGRFGAKPKGI